MALKDDFDFTPDESQLIDEMHPSISAASVAFDKANVDLDWVETCRINGIVSDGLAEIGQSAAKRKEAAERVLKGKGGPVQ